MTSVRLRITVPINLGAALRALASARGESVSTLVAAAIAREVRRAALDQALAEADLRFGALPAADIHRATTELDVAARALRSSTACRR